MSWARLPSWLWPTAEILNFGQSYPDGDPDQMRALGDRWSGLADRLEGWIGAIKNAVQDVGAHLVGESQASFHQQSDYMISDGQTNLESTVASMRQVQGMTYNAATSIDYTQQQQDFFCAMAAYQVAQLTMTAAGAAAVPGVYAAFRQLARLAFQDCSEVVARDAEATAIAAMLAEQAPKVFEQLGADMSRQLAQDLGEKAAQTLGRDGLSTLGRDAAGDLGAGTARQAGEDLLGQGTRVTGREMAASVVEQGGRAAARDAAADFVGQAAGTAGRHALADLATDSAGDIARRQLAEAAARDGAGLITKVGGDAAEKAAAKLPLKAIGEEVTQDGANAIGKKEVLKELAKKAAWEGVKQARQGAALDLAIQADQIARGQRGGFDAEQFVSTALSWGGGVVLGHPAGELVGEKLAQRGFVAKFVVGAGVAAALNVPGMALGDTAGRALFQAGEAGLGVLDPTGGHHADWSHVTFGLNPQQFLAIGAMHGLGMVNSELGLHKGLVAPADFVQVNEMFGNLAVRSTAPDAAGPDDGFRQDYQHRLGNAYAEARAYAARTPGDPVPLKKFQRLREELDARQGVTSDRRTGEVPKPAAGPANRTTEVNGRGGATDRAANGRAGRNDPTGDPGRRNVTAAGPVITHRAESAVLPSHSVAAAGPEQGRAEPEAAKSTVPQSNSSLSVGGDGGAEGAAGLPYHGHRIGETGAPDTESAAADSHGVSVSDDHVDAKPDAEVSGPEPAGYGDLHRTVVDAREQADQRWAGALAAVGVDVAAADPAALAALRDAAANDHAFVGRNEPLDRGPRDAARREFAAAAHAVGIDLDAVGSAKLRALHETGAHDRETREGLSRLNLAAEKIGDEADPSLLAYARAIIAHQDASVRFDEAAANLPEHAAWLLRSPANRFGTVDTLTRLLSGGNGIELTDAQRAELHDAVIAYQLTGIESATARAHIDAAHAGSDGSASHDTPASTGQLRRGLSGTLPPPSHGAEHETTEPASAVNRRPADELAGMDGSVPKRAADSTGKRRDSERGVPGHTDPGVARGVDVRQVHARVDGDEVLDRVLTPDADVVFADIPEHGAAEPYPEQWHVESSERLLDAPAGLLYRMLEGGAWSGLSVVDEVGIHIRELLKQSAVGREVLDWLNELPVREQYSDRHPFLSRLGDFSPDLQRLTMYTSGNGVAGLASVLVHEMTHAKEFVDGTSVQDPGRLSREEYIRAKLEAEVRCNLRQTQLERELPPGHHFPPRSVVPVFEGEYARAIADGATEDEAHRLAMDRAVERLENMVPPDGRSYHETYGRAWDRHIRMAGASDEQGHRSPAGDLIPGSPETLDEVAAKRMRTLAISRNDGRNRFVDVGRELADRAEKQGIPLDPPDTVRKRIQREMRHVTAELSTAPAGELPGLRRREHQLRVLLDMVDRRANHDAGVGQVTEELNRAAAAATVDARISRDWRLTRLSEGAYLTTGDEPSVLVYAGPGAHDEVLRDPAVAQAIAGLPPDRVIRMTVEVARDGTVVSRAADDHPDTPEQHERAVEPGNWAERATAARLAGIRERLEPTLVGEWALGVLDGLRIEHTDDPLRQRYESLSNRLVLDAGLSDEEHMAAIVQAAIHVETARTRGSGETLSLLTQPSPEPFIDEMLAQHRRALAAEIVSALQLRAAEVSAHEPEGVHEYTDAFYRTWNAEAERMGPDRTGEGWVRAQLDRIAHEAGLEALRPVIESHLENGSFYRDIYLGQWNRAHGVVSFEEHVRNQTAVAEPAARPINAAHRIDGVHKVETVRLYDGTPAIRKTLADKDFSAADELSSLVARTLGLNFPATVAIRKAVYHATRADSDGSELLRMFDPANRPAVVDLHAALVGVGVNGGDRIGTGDGNAWLNDHVAFGAGPSRVGESDTHAYLNPDGTVREHAMTLSQVRRLREMMRALRPDFERLGHSDWHESMMGRIDELEAHARPDSAARPGDPAPFRQRATSASDGVPPRSGGASEGRQDGDGHGPRAADSPDAEGEPQLAEPDHLGRIRDLLSQTQVGHDALAALDELPIGVRFEQLPDHAVQGHFRGEDQAVTVYTVGHDRIGQAMTLVHELVHAKRFADGTHARVVPERYERADDYVAAKVDEETSCFLEEARFARELRTRIEQTDGEQFTLTDPHVSAYERAYVRAESRGMSPDEADAAAQQALRKAVFDDYAEVFAETWAEVHRTGVNRFEFYEPISPDVADDLRVNSQKVHVLGSRTAESVARMDRLREQTGITAEDVHGIRAQAFERLAEIDARIADGVAAEDIPELLRQRQRLHELVDSADEANNEVAGYGKADRDLQDMAISAVAERFAEQNPGGRIAETVVWVPAAELRVAGAQVHADGRPERLLVLTRRGAAPDVLGDPRVAAEIARVGPDRAIVASVQVDNQGNVSLVAADPRASALPDPAVVEPMNSARGATESRLHPILEVLGRTEAGAWARDRMRTVRIVHTAEPGEHGYDPSTGTLTLDAGLSDAEHILALAHNAVHVGSPDSLPSPAQHRTPAHEGSGPDDYVNSMVALETRAHAMEIIVAQQLRGATIDMPEPLGARTFLDAVDRARAELGAGDGEVPGWTHALLDHPVGRAALEALESEVRARTTYADRYRAEWESERGVVSFAERVRVLELVAHRTVETVDLRRPVPDVRSVEEVTYSTGEKLTVITFGEERHAAAVELSTGLARGLGEGVRRATSRDGRVWIEQERAPLPAGRPLDPVTARAVHDILSGTPDRAVSRHLDFGVENRSLSAAARRFGRPGPDGRIEFIDHSLTPEQMDGVRSVVEQLRPEFERLGHTDWHDELMTRVDRMTEHAGHPEAGVAGHRSGAEWDAQQGIPDGLGRKGDSANTADGSHVHESASHTPEPVAHGGRSVPEPEQSPANDECCAVSALSGLVEQLGPESGILLPEQPIGPSGMSGKELMARAGGELVDYGSHEAIKADLLSREDENATALVVDMYRDPADPDRIPVDANGIGGHAYLMSRRGDAVWVKDMWTGEEFEFTDPAQLPSDVSTSAIVFDGGSPDRTLDDATRQEWLRQAQAELDDPDRIGIGAKRAQNMSSVLRFLAQHGVEHAADRQEPTDPAAPGHVARLIEAIGLQEAFGNHPDPGRALRELAEEVRAQAEHVGAAEGELFGRSEQQNSAGSAPATPRGRSLENARDELLQRLGLGREDLAGADRGNHLEQLRVRNVLRAGAIEALADHALRAESAATPEERARLGAIRDGWARRLGADPAAFETPAGTVRRLAELRNGVIQRANDIGDLVALDSALRDPGQEQQIVVELGPERVRLRVEPDDAGDWRVVDEVPRESAAAEQADDASGAGKKSWPRRVWRRLFAPPIRQRFDAPSGSGTALAPPRPHGQPHPDVASGSEGTDHAMPFLDHLSAVNDAVTKKLPIGVVVEVITFVKNRERLADAIHHRHRDSDFPPTRLSDGTLYQPEFSEADPKLFAQLGLPDDLRGHFNRGGPAESEPPAVGQRPSLTEPSPPANGEQHTPSSEDRAALQDWLREADALRTRRRAVADAIVDFAREHGLDLPDLTHESVQRAVDHLEYRIVRRTAVIDGWTEASEVYHEEDEYLRYSRHLSRDDNEPIRRLQRDSAWEVGDEFSRIILGWESLPNRTAPPPPIREDLFDSDGNLSKSTMPDLFEKALRREQISQQRASWEEMLIEDPSRDPERMTEARIEMSARTGQAIWALEELRSLARKYESVDDKFRAVTETLVHLAGEEWLADDPNATQIEHNVWRVGGRLVVLDAALEHDEILARALAKSPSLAVAVNRNYVVPDYRVGWVEPDGSVKIGKLDAPQARHLDGIIDGRRVRVTLVRDDNGAWRPVPEDPIDPAPDVGASNHPAAHNASAGGPRSRLEVEQDLHALGVRLGLEKSEEPEDPADPERPGRLLREGHELVEDERLRNGVRAVQIEALVDYARKATEIEEFAGLAQAHSDLAGRLGVAASDLSPERVAAMLSNPRLGRTARGRIAKELTDFAGELREADPAAVDGARDRLARRLGGKPKDLFPKKFDANQKYVSDETGLSPKRLSKAIHRAIELEGDGPVTRALTEYARTLMELDESAKAWAGDTMVDPRIVGDGISSPSHTAYADLYSLVRRLVGTDEATPEQIAERLVDPQLTKQSRGVLIEALVDCVREVGPDHSGEIAAARDRLARRLAPFLLRGLWQEDLYEQVYVNDSRRRSDPNGIRDARYLTNKIHRAVLRSPDRALAEPMADFVRAVLNAEPLARRPEAAPVAGGELPVYDDTSPAHLRDVIGNLVDFADRLGGTVHTAGKDGVHRDWARIMGLDAAREELNKLPEYVKRYKEMSNWRSDAYKDLKARYKRHAEAFKAHGNNWRKQFLSRRRKIKSQAQVEIQRRVKNYVRVFDAYRDGVLEKHERLNEQELAKMHSDLRDEVRERATLLAQAATLFDEHRAAVVVERQDELAAAADAVRDAVRARDVTEQRLRAAIDRVAEVEKDAADRGDPAAPGKPRFDTVIDSRQLPLVLGRLRGHTMPEDTQRQRDSAQERRDAVDELERAAGGYHEAVEAVVRAEKHHEDLAVRDAILSADARMLPGEPRVGIIDGPPRRVAVVVRGESRTPGEALERAVELNPAIDEIAGPNRENVVVLRVLTDSDGLTTVHREAPPGPSGGTAAAAPPDSSGSGGSPAVSASGEPEGEAAQEESSAATSPDRSGRGGGDRSGSGGGGPSGPGSDDPDNGAAPPAPAPPPRAPAGGSSAAPGSASSQQGSSPSGWTTVGVARPHQATTYAAEIANLVVRITDQVAVRDRALADVRESARLLEVEHWDSLDADQLAARIPAAYEALQEDIDKHWERGATSGVSNFFYERDRLEAKLQAARPHYNAATRRLDDFGRVAEVVDELRSEAATYLARDVIASEHAEPIRGNDLVAFLPGRPTRLLVVSPSSEPDLLMGRDLRNQQAQNGIEIIFRQTQVDEAGQGTVIDLRPPD